MRGLSALLRIYQRVITPGAKFRINDFDGDLKLEVDVRETIGINLWHAPDAYEKEERKLFCDAILPGSTVLDVGANIGVFTLLAAKRGARVYAIEADPENARMLKHHVELNGYSDKVTVFEIGASDRDQVLPLYRNAANSGGSTLYGTGEAVDIRCRSIDSLNLPPIDVCKMDVEGGEWAALQGMSATISRSPDFKLLVEYSSSYAGSARVLEFLRGRFKNIQVVGGKLLNGSKSPPTYCNFWVSEPVPC